MAGDIAAQQHSLPVLNGNIKYPTPPRISGALGGFKYEESTPVIGREYINVNIVNDLLEGDNADERLRDLAITST